MDRLYNENGTVSSKFAMHQLMRKWVLWIVFVISVIAAIGLLIGVVFRAAPLEDLIVVPMVLGIAWGIYQIVDVYDPLIFLRMNLSADETAKKSDVEDVFKHQLIRALEKHKIDSEPLQKQSESFEEFVANAIGQITVQERDKTASELEQSTAEFERKRSRDENFFGREIEKLKQKLKDSEAQIKQAKRDYDNKLNLQKYDYKRTLTDEDLTSEIEIRMATRADNDDRALDADRAFQITKAILSLFAIREPNRLDELKEIAHVSEEAKRISQYDTIIRLYNDKIAGLRNQDMDEEDREEAILAMKRLRDREIDALEQA